MKRRRSDLAGLDMSRLQTLADELGNPEPALRFLDKYLAMLPQRIERITHALDARDTTETTTALLSLKISSSMVGDREAEHQCRAIESMLKDDHLEDAAIVVPALQQMADRCVTSRSDLITAAHACLSSSAGFFRS